MGRFYDILDFALFEGVNKDGIAVFLKNASNKISSYKKGDIVVLQDSLSVGYETKSNDLMRRVNTLDSAHRKQAIDLFEAILSVLGKPV